MAKVIAFTMSAAGHLFPFMCLLKELRSRGHEVSVALCMERPARSTLATIPLFPLEWMPASFTAIGKPARGMQRVEPAFAAFGQPLVEAVRHVVDTEHPDVLVVDPSLWGAMVAAKASSYPWVTIAHNPMLFRGRGLDPRGPGYPPPRSVVGALARRAVAEHLRWKGRHRLRIVNAVRATYGLGALARYSDMFFEPDAILATTVEPLEYPRDDWPDNLLFVGPLHWEPTPPADWRFDLADDRPLVLLVGSSVRDDDGTPPWAAQVLQALADEPYHVVATLPSGELPRDVPTNATVTRTLPHGLLLERAACVICHGGPGITNKALSRGVPVVSVPYALDRHEVARRIEVAGAGVTLSIKHLQPRRIRRAIRVALSDGVRTAAGRLAGVLANAGGASVAADEVEAVLRRHRRLQARAIEAST